MQHNHGEATGGWDRRTLLRAGTLSALGLGLPELLYARRQRETGHSRAKACILLFATGGPSQHETFDPKPDADVGIAGEFRPISTSVPEIQFCEHLPMLAKQARHLAVIRSTYHGSGTHGVGVVYNLTGHKPASRPRGEPQMSRLDHPALGSAVRQLRGDRGGLPAYVHLPVRIGDQNNFQWGGQNAGFLGPKYDPLMMIDEKWTPGTLPPSFQPSKQIDPSRFQTRASLLSQLERSRLNLEETDGYRRAREDAFDALRSSAAWRAFVIEEEKPETIERYGDNKFGRSCLVARRLVEAGVGLVTVPWMHLHSTKNFDTHSKHFRLMKDLLLPPMDRAFSALIEDLHQRGLLEETLVAWTGEFGRTPKINKNAGRDHWGNVYSTVLAGGGIRGGLTYGSSDRNGAEPVDDAVHTSDFIATIYQALGYGSSTVVYDTGGRPHPLIAGEPVKSLFS